MTRGIIEEHRGGIASTHQMDAEDVNAMILSRESLLETLNNITIRITRPTGMNSE